MNETTLKNDYQDLKNQAQEKTSQIANEAPKLMRKGQEMVEDSVESHPLSSIGFAAAIGFILGLIFHKS